MRAESDPHRRKVQTQILSATALIAGSSVISVVCSIVRVKAVAVMLGPSGVGLMGLYTSIADLAQSVASMGIQSSGVRQIAEAAGSGDSARIARTVLVLRRSSMLLGLGGAALLAAFATPFSVLTFGSAQQSWGVALLGIAVFLRVLSGAQTAMLQGMRRISDLTRMGIVAAALSTLFTVILIFSLGTEGIVISLIAVAAASFLVSSYYSSKVSIDRVPMTASQVRQEATALLTLGFAFLASGFLSLGAAYVIRIMVLWADGVEAAGRYQAAWTIGGLYAGFVLQAMGTDFYPRLTAVCRDDGECTRLVNEQTQISLLLAGPGVIATLTFAPLVLHVFYSAEFQSAVSILRWVCLGMMLRVAAWPMGFIVVAKGAQRTLIIIEVIAALLHVGLAWLLIRRFGTDGAGVAFCGLYICYTALVYVIVNRLSGFRWSAENLQLGCVLLGLAPLVFWSVTMLRPLTGSLVGGTAAALVGVYCIRRLLHFVSPALLPRPLRGWVIAAESEGP